MRWFQLAALAVILSLCGCYEKEGSYSTVDDARVDGLFELGGLPDILPVSAYDIRVTINGDTEYSEGEFWFDPSDFSRFASHFDSFYQPFEYTVDGRSWVFFCDSVAGHCCYSVR